MKRLSPMLRSGSDRFARIGEIFLSLRNAALILDIRDKGTGGTEERRVASAFAEVRETRDAQEMSVVVRACSAIAFRLPGCGATTPVGAQAAGHP